MERPTRAHPSVSDQGAGSGWAKKSPLNGTAPECASRLLTSTPDLAADGRPPSTKGETFGDYSRMPSKNRSGLTARFRGHPFERSCRTFDIEHRLTKPKHPWTNRPVERMNRTIKEATVKRFHYETPDQLRSHLADFVSAYNFAKRLKTLKGLTPYEAICKAWTKSRNDSPSTQFIKCRN